MELLLMLIGRLGYFERKHKFYDQKQLMSEITGHYSQQVCVHFWSLFLFFFEPGMEMF